MHFKGGLTKVSYSFCGPEQGMGCRSSLLTLGFAFLHGQVCVSFSSPFLPLLFGTWLVMAS